MEEVYNIIENNLFWFLVFPYIMFGIFVLLMYKHRKDKTHSISKCMVYTKKRYYSFIICLLLGSLPLYTTLIFYLVPKYNVTILASIVAVLIYISQSILAIFPDKDGLRQIIHAFAAFITGFFTILYSLLITITGTMESYLKIIPLQFVIVVSILLFLLLFSKWFKKHVFIIEVISILDWVITIFILAFIK